MKNNNLKQNEKEAPNINDNQNKNDNLNIKKDRIIHMNIQNNFLSSNSQYVKHNNTRSSKNIKNKEDEKENQKEKEKGRKYSNKDLLNPLIHFTNLSSKKLKILGSISNK